MVIKKKKYKKNHMPVTFPLRILGISLEGGGKDLNRWLISVYDTAGGGLQARIHTRHTRRVRRMKRSQIIVYSLPQARAKFLYNR